MIKLSVIIVSYNVRYFLEQTLSAVEKASEGLPVETFVVDNCSDDGSVEMVRQTFPQVQIIENRENAGFSKANNQAIRQSAGEYVLLLNPDTVVQEDTFRKCIAFMDAHPEAGALGVKMIDGSGKFLPESKRSLPTPEVAFYKIFGLSRLFPKSRRFGKYHLGYLDENKTHEIEVLSGAFMLLRKSTLEKTGLLDETFFMYGEDIDLSYRIIKAGYKNYYFPETTIIHYKGESTKRKSLNYVKVFYNAMVIFAEKHFKKERARLFSSLINMAIYFRAGLAMFSRFFAKVALPVFDALILYAGMLWETKYWERNHRFVEGGEYPDTYYEYVMPAYILIWITSLIFTGGYDRPLKLMKIVRGLIIGTIVIVITYAFLPETLRFSRALVLLGAVWAVIAITGSRLLFRAFKNKSLQLSDAGSKRTLIVGEKQEINRFFTILSELNVSLNLAGKVNPDKDFDPEKDDYFAGSIDQLGKLAAIFNANEIIFCSGHLQYGEMIRWMYKLKDVTQYRIVSQKSQAIIGSSSSVKQGELFSIDINHAINTPSGRRNKRLLDIITSLMLLISTPFTLFMVEKPARFISNIFIVLFGKKTWVGYAPDETNSLPEIRPGVLSPLDKINDPLPGKSNISHINFFYAKDYSIWYDLEVIFKGFRRL